MKSLFAMLPILAFAGLVHAQAVPGCDANATDNNGFAICSADTAHDARSNNYDRDGRGGYGDRDRHDGDGYGDHDGYGHGHDHGGPWPGHGGGHGGGWPPHHGPGYPPPGPGYPPPPNNGGYFPPGSYALSCTQCGMQGPILTCECRSSRGQWFWSSIDSRMCRSIQNREGYLTCE